MIVLSIFKTASPFRTPIRSKLMGDVRVYQAETPEDIEAVCLLFAE